MAISNFVITIVGLGAVAYLMKSDIRGSSAMLRRNLKHIRGWMEEQGAAAEQTISKEAKQVTESKPAQQPPVRDPAKPE
ncbi:hypothetical protein ACKKBG_A12760 [Auxenochlorella protothecoides x Auxenochlorella symbiontica]